MAYDYASRCITSPPRIWNEVPALFSPPVSDVFSGGIAFSYFPTSDGYGMVTFSADGKTYVSISMTNSFVVTHVNAAWTYRTTLPDCQRNTTARPAQPHPLSLLPLREH